MNEAAPAKRTLFRHVAHPHQPRNVNRLHQAEIAAAGFNTRLAIEITRATGTMACAYVFAVLALIGLFGILGVLSPIVILLVAWISQTFLQLVFLPILSVGQGVLSRKQELQSDESFHFAEKSFHDIEQIMEHLNQQDQAILEILQRLEARP